MKSYLGGLVMGAIVVGAPLAPTIAHAEASSVETVEETVRAYFEDTPVMIEIARCESKFKQFNTDGTPLRGGWNNQMVGVFQLYESIHTSSALALGFDITTLDGNIKYAEHLYNESGTTPWDSAKACWDVPLQSKTSNELSDAKRAEILAQIATLKKLIAQLQLLLEAKRLTASR